MKIICPFARFSHGTVFSFLFERYSHNTIFLFERCSQNTIFFSTFSAGIEAHLRAHQSEERQQDFLHVAQPGS